MHGHGARTISTKGTVFLKSKVPKKIEFCNIMFFDLTISAIDSEESNLCNKMLLDF